MSRARAPRRRPGLVSEVRHAGRVLRAVLVYLYLPLVGLLVALHFPYDTDASVAAAARDGGEASSFYEKAYRPADAGSRGLDYEETAARAARAADIEGRLRAFVAGYGLERARVLDVGSGRGYLQDIVDDYTGLDLSPTVASHYHKPFVVGSATDMPFPDDSFDAAWTVWVVEHIPEPERALAEMRRVIRPGGLLYLLVAWNCPPWAAGGFQVRPYEDFTLPGKLVKATIPVRRLAVFDALHRLPTRLLRWGHYLASGERTNLHFRALQPNYEIYWQPDSDATASLDRFESLLWFRSRGDECLNCLGMPAEWFDLGETPLILRISKP